MYVWVFAVGTNSAIYENQFSGSWSGWTSDGGTFSGVPGFSEDSGGSFHLFGRTTGGHFEQNTMQSGSSTWSGWADLGGSLLAPTT